MFGVTPDKSQKSWIKRSEKLDKAILRELTHRQGMLEHQTRRLDSFHFCGTMERVTEKAHKTPK